MLRRFFYSDPITKNSDNSLIDNYNCYISISYSGKESQKLAQSVTKLIKLKFEKKISPIHKTFKINVYFPLKSRTPLVSCSNVVYKFTCSCDTKLTYIGMSSRHLGTRATQFQHFTKKCNQRPHHVV